MTFENVSNQPFLARTKNVAVYQALRQQILSGHRTPGSVLRADEVAAEFGVSTTPVREALGRLEADGLLVMSPHREPIVLPLSKQEVKEVYTIRRELDPLAARLATERASTDDAREVQELVKASESAAPDKKLSANRELHRKVYSVCGNGLLVKTLDGLWDLSDRCRLLVVAMQPPEDTIAEHRAIAEAFARRDADEVAHLVREHVQHSMTSLQNQLDETAGKRP